MLELKLLGDFDLRDGSFEPVVVGARKNKALLAILALAPSASLARERIVRLLWSDRGQVQAQASLRQSLVALRKDMAALPLPLIQVIDDRLTLDRSRLKIDAVEFQRLGASNDIESLRRAATLYRDELLADLDIKDPGFERWLGSERQRLSDLAIGLFEKLSAHETGGARIEATKRLVGLDPLREASHRMLMTAYAAAGEKGLAMRQYELCRAALNEELDVAPGEETEALRQRLLKELAAASLPARGGLLSRTEARTAHEEKPSVAVLPFDVMSADADLGDFCDGLVEDITTGLSRIKTIRVVARNTMFTYKNQAVDVRAVGRDLAVRYALEGSVRRSGTRIRVTAQLIEAANGHHVWAGKFDRQGVDAFDLQDEITSGIVASVQTQIILNEGRATALDGRADAVAPLLARSWQQFLGLTEKSLAESRTLAERALCLDPHSGFAHRMVSVCLYHQAYMGFVPWTNDLVDEAHRHAKIAIEAADADEYSHWAMACAELLRSEHERAATSLKRALQINPNCSLAHGALGTVLAWAGRPDAAVKSNEIALQINPDDPSIFFRHFGLALAHYLALRYDQALVHASAVVQARPVWWLGLLLFAASLAQSGQLGDAGRVLGELTRVLPDTALSALNVLPFASARNREHLLEGVAKAGVLG
ncbi:BTAD domain-containing putative transcriptional regulator [Mesorhizobium yinganensis]|uniref:BTAD domain-containing putative transcriptional regulator n=1 Tax=Mesorhizobium yinganensis TaxID=3157707 RepID=UPI0032B7FDA7